MSDHEWYRDTDGSHYAVFLQVPDDINDPYAVDLVRHAQDEQGLLREQRLTLAQHNSYGEAEEHLYEAEQQLQDTGLVGFDVDALTAQPYSDEPAVLTAIYPPDAQGDDLASVNLLVINEDGVQTARVSSGELHKMSQVMDRLDAVGDSGERLQTAQLEHGDEDPLFDSSLRHVDGGGTAHWFALAERAEPDVEGYELRYFRELETDDGQRLRDSYPVMPVPDADPGHTWEVLDDLETYLERGDVFMAQQLAYDVADNYGQDFPHPLDLPALDPEPEYYFGYGISDQDRPSLEVVKTWMDGAERRFDTLTVGEYGMYEEAAVDEAELEQLADTQGLQAAMTLAESMAVAGGYLDPDRDDSRIFFEDDAPADPFITNRDRDLAEPRYSVGAISANGESFLDIYKEWGTDGYERLIVPQPDWEQAHDKALEASDLLGEGNLQSAMHLVELEALKAGVFDPDRDNPRLFTQGPTDPFETLAERLQDEPNPYWNTSDDIILDASELATEELPVVREPVENPYWRLDTLPVNDPDGAPLGHALHIVVYPDVPEGAHEALAENTPFKMLEVTHFETVEAADKFGEAFKGYLMPGLLEVPELAEEVARLEGHPVQYTSLGENELQAYLDGELTLTRDPSDWHPYNPNAERDARIEAEGYAPDLDL